MNKILLAILILTGFSACISRGSLDNPRQIRRVSFRGWDSTVLMSNGLSTVILNPEYGGNVLYYGLEGGDNVLWADTTVNGWTLQDFIRTRRSPDAGRFDIGNERKTEFIHDRIWAGRYKVEILSDSSVRLSSPVSEEMGIQLFRTFILDGNSTRLRIVQTISNISDEAKEYCFWTRTLLPSGGIFFCTCTDDTHETMPYAEISLTTDSVIVSSQSRIYCEDGAFCAVPGGEGEHKFGIRNMDGTASYFRNGLLYVKRNRRADTSGKYENNAGLSFPLMLYYNGTFTEIEPNSVMYDIPAGESVTETEEWELFRMDHTPEMTQASSDSPAH